MKKFDPKCIENILALTHLQEGILFHYLKNPDSGYYFEQLSLEISGKIDHKIFEEAWNVVIAANEMLRTVFHWEKLEKPSQIILKEHPCEPVFHDLSVIDNHRRETALEEIKIKDSDEGFDLTQVPFRVILCKLEQDKYEMVISNHHILYDGWSNGIILKEFFQVYHELYHGRQTPKFPPKPLFKEFVRWIQNQDRNRQEQYWSDYLAGFETPTELPIKRRAAETTNPGEYSIILEEDIKGKLDVFVKNNRVTLAAVFYSAWGILLQKYCDSEDVIFGTTVSGRSAVIKGIEDMVGLFINTIPLRTQTTTSEKIIDVVFRTDQILREREEFENTPLSDIGGYSPIGGGGGGLLFDTIVAIENYPLDSRILPEGSMLSIDSYAMVEMTHYDLSVGIMPANKIEIKFSFKQELFEKDAIENMAGHFKGIIKNMIETPEVVLSQLEILSIAEKDRILHEFNNTASEYPRDKTIHQLFVEQASRIPDRVGLVGPVGSVCLTYRQFDEQSNRLAGLLIEKGVLPDSIVAIMIERSIEMMVGIVGIVKSGGAYLPIDPEYPQERIDYMLKDSAAKIILNAHEIASLATECVFNSHQSSIINHHSSHLVYLIYTSGSTGKSKGVMIQQEGFLNLLRWYIEEFDIGEEDNCLLIAPISFDLSQKNLFSPFLAGGRLTLASPRIPDYRELAELIHKERITIINCAPSVFYPLIEHENDTDFIRLHSLRAIILGGEPIRLEKLLPWVNSVSFNCEIINTYGPTECTDIATFYRIPSESLHLLKTIPIGRPIPNVKVYVLDKYLIILPMRIPGELCIGGLGLSKGYNNNIPLTKAQFVDTPHLPGKRVYRTGDIVRWFPDGNIEFLGRSDHQVKVRGFRIELGEIESELTKHEKIKEVVVTARQSENGNNYLCAYILPHDGQKIAVSVLREFLGRQLPEYMIPSYFVYLDRIPLTPSGKVDRRGLPEPEIKKEKNYTAPRNRIEKELVAIWYGVLNIKELDSAVIGIDDNFFQLGGHSLNSTSLASRIFKELNVKIPLGEIFKRPTIRGLFEYINSAIAERYIPIEPVEEKEYYILSSAQKRLYFLHQMDNAGTAYNISAAWVLEGIIDNPSLEGCIATLIQRHESLRTSFVIFEDEPVQRIHDDVEFEIEYKNSSTDYTDYTDGRGDPLWLSFIHPFDLSKAPLLRVGLAKLAEEKYLFIVDMHHIISDGLSTEILVREFTALYSGKELPPVGRQYKDYAEWQNRLKHGETFLRQQEYWKKEYEGEIPVLDLPTDFARPAVQRFEGNRITFAISSETADKLNALALKTETTLYMALLTLYGIFLSKVSSQEDIIIGTPTAGRRYADLEKMIGVFVNTLALRTHPAGEKNFIGFLGEIKEKTLDAFENQDYQYEDLVEQAAVKRDTSRNPLFDVMFVLQNMESGEIEIPGLKIAPFDLKNKTSKFDLTLSGVEIDGKLEFTFEYCTKLFKPGTIERFIRYFKNIFSGILEDNHKRLSDLELISLEEKNWVLYDVNNTATEYPRDKTIHQLFEEQASKTPDHIALVGASLRACPARNARNASLTYRQINEQSGRLANVLIEKGVLRDNVVGIIIERSIEMIIGIFGILKSGGAYMPIDPEYPQERLDYMLKDSGAQLLVTTNDKEGDKVRRWEGKKVLFEESFLSSKSSSYRLSFLPSYLQNSSNLAYVIYTSGTTGHPKGSLIEHRNVVRLMFNDKFQFDFTGNDVWTLFHSFCFDFSVWEIYGALLYGGKLVIVPKMTTRDTGAFLKLLTREAVTVLNQTPSAFYNLINEILTSHRQEKNLYLKHVIFGGEALNPSKLKEWKEKFPRTRLINMFGITETTVHVTYKEITEKDVELNIGNIGKPIPTLSAYILDKYLKPVPVGVSGEICVGGKGVCRGYLNRVELTGGKFIENPYKPGERLYQSGDTGRFLENGDMEYLGRIDHQAKIRGFRIELGEIESQLLKHGDIKDAVVLAEETIDGKYLCAYIVPRKEFAITDLRAHLSGKLPEYMIPSYFVKLERIPLTPNGKIDRKALPGVRGDGGLLEESASPTTGTEEKLAELWESVLGIKPGINVDFFHAGGDSIKAVRLVNSINTKLAANLKIPDIYLSGTIKKLASVIDRDKTVHEYKNEELSRALTEIEELKKRVMSDPRSPLGLEDVYPMSDIQKGMVFHSLKDRESALYHDQMVYQPIIKDFKPEIFKKAFVLMVEKHSILRTALDLDTYGESVQLVYYTVPNDLEHYDISHMEQGEQEKYLLRFLAEDRGNPFQFDIPPLWRLRTFDLGGGKICVVLVTHHAILDGWSVASLDTELLNTYWQLLSNPAFTPGRLQNSYVSFIVEQAVEKKRSDAVDFWRNELDGYKRLELSSPKQNNDRGNVLKRYKYYPGNDLLLKLKDTAKNHHTTVKNLCFSAYIYMLSMLSYENEIVVGLVSNNRPLCEDGDKILGCFLNTIPVRVIFPSSISWSDYIMLMDKKLVELKKYERLPLFDIARLVGENAYDRNPIFDVMFNFVDFHVLDQIEHDYGKDNNDQLHLEDNAKTNILFDFTVSTTLRNFELYLSYSDAFFQEEKASKLCRYFEAISNKIVTNPGSTASKAELIPASERKQLLNEFNDTGAEYPGDRTIHELFEEQVKKTPDCIAVVGPGQKGTRTSAEIDRFISITYRQLDEQSNRLGRQLRQKSVQPDNIVGIMVEPSLEMIIGIFGILKSGGAYLPLDPNQPAERRSYMLSDSCAVLLLTRKHLIAEVGFNGPIISFDNSASDSVGNTHLNKINGPRNMLYSIYTSGTMGKPKGALIENRNLVNYIAWFSKKVGLSTNDRAILTSSFGFDLGYTAIYPSILSGSSLHIVHKETYLSSDELLGYIQRHQITYLKITPSLFSVLVENASFSDKSLNDLRLIVLGGEPIKLTDIEKAHTLYKHLQIMNHYGPTETTIGCIAQLIDFNEFGCYKETPTIGHPINNMKIFILDKGLTLLPIGVPGEVCISGPGVGRGYLNHPELTGEKFVKHPYLGVDRMYCTGDLARWTERGEVEFLGRLDKQVKIRGFRIELGEIENRLLKHEDIKEAVIEIRGDRLGDKSLAAYFVSDRDIPGSELMEYLLKDLPEYMIPSYFVCIEKFPLTPNGKIDRRALPEPILRNITEYEAPGDEIERKMVEIWSSVLGIEKEKISIDSNFFKIGGHSLKATIIAAKIHKLLNLRISLADMFKNPTIRGLSGILRELKKDRFVPIEPSEKKEYYVLSYAQKRIYTALQLELDSTSYNMAITLRLIGEIDKERLQATFRELIKKHESLRTSFEIIGTEPVQRVHDEVEFAIEYRGVGEGSSGLKNCIWAFDLTRAPLLRVYLSKLGDREYAMMMDISHLISDGVSSMLIARDLVTLYSRQELPILKIQYKEFAEWENRLYQTGKIKKQEDFWLDAFKGELPVMELPTDFPRPDVRNVEAGDMITFALKESTKRKLYEMIGEMNCTLFTILLGVFNILLNKYSGQDDIVVGVVVTGRTHEDLENVMGVFVNILPFRSRLQPEKRFRDFLEEIRENALHAFENQEYPMEELMKRLRIRKKPSRHPLFDVAFNLNNIEKVELKHTDFEIASHKSDQDFAKFDLTLYAVESMETIDFYFRYSTQLFKRSTIEKLKQYYIEIIEQTVDNLEINLKDIKVSHRRVTAKSNARQFDGDNFILT